MIPIWCLKQSKKVNSAGVISGGVSVAQEALFHIVLLVQGTQVSEAQT